MNKELIDAIKELSKQKEIKEEILLDAVESSLVTAIRNHLKNEQNGDFKSEPENIRVDFNRETGDSHIYVIKTVVESEDDVEEDYLQITLEKAKAFNPEAKVGETVDVEYKSKDFSRIAAQVAKNTILQKIREEERNSLYNHFHELEKTVIKGRIRRSITNSNGKSFVVDLKTADGILNEKEMIKGEHFREGDSISVYVVEVKHGNKEPRIMVSRTHPDFVKALFEREVEEIKNGIVKIERIAREPGSRTKIAVLSTDPNVDPVGACVGVNGTRVNAVVEELGGEKIDIINWDDNPGNLIQNALSPAQTVAVFADPDENSAKVVVPDNQLSLAIGKEGQNARLAAKLTEYKIDIKSETQAVDAVGFRYSDYLDEYEGDSYYDENGNPIYDASEYEVVEYTTDENYETEEGADGTGTDGSDDSEE